MKNKKKTRRIAIVLACILIPLGAFGFGYFTANKEVSNQVAHTLTVNGDITGSITESVTTDVTGIVPGDQVESTINIQPTSTADSLLRVKVKPYWMNDSGGEDTGLSSTNLKLLESSSIKTDLSENSWYKEGDYYYYINKVNSRTGEINLIKGIEFLALDNPDYDANKYQNKKIGIKVTMEMVQCSSDAYKFKWNSLSTDLNSKLDELSPASKTIE